MVKNMPAVQETRVQSLGWKDPLEKGMANHSPVFLPGKYCGQRNLAGYSPRGRKESDMTEQASYMHSHSSLQPHKVGVITPMMG